MKKKMLQLDIAVERMDQDAWKTPTVPKSEVTSETASVVVELSNEEVTLPGSGSSSEDWYTLHMVIDVPTPKKVIPAAARILRAIGPYKDICN